jgi:hypothetical protein
MSTTREPLEVKTLLTADQRRLAEALDTAPPLPASMSEDCRDCIRKIYQAAPMDMPNTNRRKETDRVFQILDELETGKDTH